MFYLFSVTKSLQTLAKDFELLVFNPKKGFAFSPKLNLNGSCAQSDALNRSVHIHISFRTFRFQMVWNTNGSGKNGCHFIRNLNGPDYSKP